jgi:hypothetical protein
MGAPYHPADEASPQPEETPPTDPMLPVEHFIPYYVPAEMRPPADPAVPPTDQATLAKTSSTGAQALRLAFVVVIIIVTAVLVLLGQTVQGAFTLIFGAVLLAITVLDKIDKRS